jgi:hypothetical protein
MILTDLRTGSKDTQQMHSRDRLGRTLRDPTTFLTPTFAFWRYDSDMITTILCDMVCP